MTDSIPILNNNSDSPLVSVVSVTYNSARYVRDTISSVLSQSYPNIEYIIGDDNSSDGTWEIINEFKDPRIIAYRNESNLKEYVNRNKAIQLAKGKYLIFIDGDDIIYPHAIITFLDYIEKYPEACMAIQKGYLNNAVFPFLLQPVEQYLNYFFGNVNLLVSSFASNFFRLEHLKKFMLSEKYKSGDDEIRLRLAASYPVLYIPGWLTWPRETPGQASSQIPEDVALIQAIDYINNILTSDNIISRNPELAYSIREKLKWKCAEFCKRSLMKGRINKVLDFLRDSGFSSRDLIATKNVRVTDVLAISTPINPYKEQNKVFQ